MFDSFKGASRPAKFITIFVVGIVLGLGLCGAGVSLSNGPSRVADKLLGLGAASFWISGFGLLVSLLALTLVGGKDRRR